MPARPLVRGTLALTAAGLFSRVTGSVYRILLVRVIGEIGIGLFQMAFPFYALGATVATLGLPGALAKLVAERAARDDWPGVERARRVALALTLAATAVTLALAWSLAGPAAALALGDARTRLALALVPLAVACTALSSILRGYAYGLKELTPSAAAQVLEQAVRIVAVLALASLLVPYGLAAAAGGAAAGLVLGELSGLVYLVRWLRRDQQVPRPWRSAPPARGRDRGTLGELLRLGLPNLATDLVGALVAAADAVIIPRRLLDAGVPWDEAVARYGELTGMVLPVLFLPMVFTYPLATALLPLIAEAQALGNRASLVRAMLLGTRLTLAVALASAAVFHAAPAFLARLLYGRPALAPLIALLAVAAPFTYVQSMSNAILVGLGLNAASFRNYLVGVVVRLTLIYVLAARPGLGIAGALWGIVAGQAVMASLHALDLRRATGRFPLP